MSSLSILAFLLEHRGEQEMARFRIALLGALFSAMLIAPAALGYNGEVEQQVDVNGPIQVVCPAQDRTFTATVVDRDGKPLGGVQVTWSTGQVTTTAANGKTSITVDLTASGSVTATTAGGAVGSHAFTCIQGQVGGAIGLPRTDTALPADSAPAPSSWAFFAFVFVVVAGLGFARVTRRRR